MTKKIGGYLVHEAAKMFPLMVGPEFDAFCDDIQDNGVLQEVVTWRDESGVEWLLDGRNRLRACERTGAKWRVTHYRGSDPFTYVVSHNLHRRHLAESQRAMVGARLKEVLDRDQPKDKGGSPPKSEGVANRPQPTERNPPVRDKAARAVNVSGRSVQKAVKVLSSGTPELAAAVDAGLVKVDLAVQMAELPPDEQRHLVRKIAESPHKNARAVLRQHDREAAAANMGAPVPLPGGPFSVLLVNTPWPHGRRTGDNDQRQAMSLEDLVAFAGDMLAPLAHEDSVLLLRITSAHLVAGDHAPVLKAAGFTGKAMLACSGAMATADWLRGQAEHFVLATRGRPSLKLSGKASALPSVADPEWIYSFVEKLCPGNRIELFAQGEREGWTAWGADAGDLSAELGL